MTITRKLGLGYALAALACLVLLFWLWWREFVVEPAEFAARGLTDLHQNTAVELAAVVLLALIPVLLGLGWWWTFRLLAPLRALTRAAEHIESNNLQVPLPPSQGDDEVARLSAVLGLMTARLDASFRQIRDFTLHASHELKTPLTVMRAQLETARREQAALPPAQTEWVESLLDEVERLAKIVDSLSLLTKADAGLVELERQPVDFGELVQEAYEDACILAQPAEVQVVLGDCVPARLAGDRHRLRQLLLILVDNAVKYNRPGGGMHLELRAAGGSAEFRITNDGGAVESGSARRLFGRFTRGANAMGRVEGCGLGLSIAEWIVQSHQGSIELLPQPGERTTVVVRLPLLQP